VELFFVNFDMKIKHILLGILSLCSLLRSQTFDNLSFGTDSTFDILTWNIEHFPKNGETTEGLLIEAIEALSPDLLAIQEVSDTNAFWQVVGSLENYSGYLKSGYFAGLAYIYHTHLIQINDIYEIYTSYPYWSPFPRSPMVMDCYYEGERFFVINNHFKCCGDGILDEDNVNDEENRRLIASNLLKAYIDQNLADEKVILLGDLNDNLCDASENNVFREILQDSLNYRFTDYEIASGNSSDWSYPTWPSHLDHILITNELFGAFEHRGSEIRTLKLDEYFSSWWGYDQNLSDHRPVALKLFLQQPVKINHHSHSKVFFSVSPNPFNSQARFQFDSSEENLSLEIYDIYGRQVFSRELEYGQNNLLWDASELSAGLYIARCILENGLKASAKLILLK
jgi:endonuclease/exonuclease/phosphatase family metal-dependent hydrolase